MKPSSLVLCAFVVFSFPVAGQPSEFAAGRASYAGGEFKEAVAHFKLALKANPADAASNYWIGMAYEALGDTAWPLAGKYNAKARVYLTKAVELAPTRSGYRAELFNFLLESAGSSRSALQRATAILGTVSESDPEYSSMRLHFELERKANSTADARLDSLFLTGPREALRLAELSWFALVDRLQPRFEATIKP